MTPEEREAALVALRTAAHPDRFSPPTDGQRLDALLALGWRPPTSTLARSTWATLGEIAETLGAMRAQGVTRESIAYVVERVFWQEIEEHTE